MTDFFKIFGQAEDGGRRAEDRGQRTEDRGQRWEVTGGIRCAVTDLNSTGQAEGRGYL